ncbi:MAG: ABC transporter ATP-binding protein [Euryarchaeota archaeon]|nr:ABC transporter ATP-binding protein [Euryarchaeota archaeon]
MILEAKNVSKIYGDGTAKVFALDNISLQVNEGDYIAVMGPSGSGKTTLLNVLGGLDRPTKGEIILDGMRIDNLNENALVNIRRGKIAYVFQEYHLIPSLTALENVMLPLIFSGSPDGTQKQRAIEMLGKVGLSRRANHKPTELSGGEQQRVSVARALVNNPTLILADEPTGNLDYNSGLEIQRLFDQLNEEGHTILMVTHDPEKASHAKRLILFKDGKIVEDKNQDDKK